MTRWELCNDHLALFHPSRFLEIGVKRGTAGKRIQADFKLGVDPEPAGLAHKYYTQLYKQTSDEFFAEQANGSLNLHCVLVDGLHHADQAMRDVLHSLDHLSPVGIIVLHDCNPQTEGAQIVPRQQVHWNGDVWKVIVTLRATRSDLRVYVLDMDEGLGVISWAAIPERLIALPGDLTWERLVDNRSYWLGLVPPW